MTHIAVIILNFNRQRDTLACLRSLAQSTHVDRSTLVLNYGAPGGDDVRAEQVCADPRAQSIDLALNKGYAGNNNIGVKMALRQGADWVLVLNEDTEIDAECLTRMLACGESDSRVGIVGPMVYHHDEPTVIQSAGGVLDADWRALHAGQNETDQGQFGQRRDVAWVSGCAILLRRALLEQVGLLDERMFMYWEEIDWCMRARAAGWRVLHEPSARLWHKGVRRDYKPGAHVAYYMTRNHLYMLHKHGAPARVCLGAWRDTLRTLISYSIRPRWRVAKSIDRLMIRRALRDYLAGRWGEMPA